MACTKPAQTAPYPNLYHARRVAETVSKPCYICYKPTTIVLVTPCQKDFFYTCQTHLSDRGFATPKISQEELDRKRKEEEMAKEKERLLKEYEEKKAKKKEKDNDKDNDKKSKDDKDKEKKDDKDGEGKDSAEKKDSAKAKVAETQKELEYRIYELHRDIYKMRLTRTIQAANQRRIQELIRSPDAFPEAPRGFG